MKIKGTFIKDTYAEAFKMVATRFIVTASDSDWLKAAVTSATGFATSVIGCKCEAGLECELSLKDSPDGRPAASLLLFSMGPKGMAQRLLERIGQCIMTCPSTACFDGLGKGSPLPIGAKLRYFGDGYQISKLLADGRRVWRVPVMEGEFLVDETFYCQPAVGGGNFLILGVDDEITRMAAKRAVKAMLKVPGIILPFPGGVVRSGSKVGSRYAALMASTNDAYCPSLKALNPDTQLPAKVQCVLEIVVNGMDLQAVERAMRIGINAACGRGIAQIGAGNYGGKLGQYHIHLQPLLQTPARKIPSKTPSKAARAATANKSPRAARASAR
ncbi:MAG: formylmethanofuran--tetrahydromethanopterin N-formyltransferase [Candidatus Eutrophobiaceae bacterium]